MAHWDASSDEHARFRELAAAATCGALTGEERENLAEHLRDCEECRLVFREYQTLATEGFASLARNYEHPDEMGSWNETAARRRLLARARSDERLHAGIGVTPGPQILLRRFAWPAALAACLLAGVGIGAWQFGNQAGKGAAAAEPSPDIRLADLLSAKTSAESALAMKNGELARLQADGTVRRRELEAVESQVRALQAHLTTGQTKMEDLSKAKERAESQLSQVTLQRDQLSEQLRNARRAYDLVETEVDGARTERDEARLELVSLEARIKDVTALNQDQEKRLKDNEQYLASDRDIRDLMSARNLYIADVFDVDGQSRTRKPFGRVFFTRGKSLLFYAYDLDQQPRLKAATTFQVWGQKETGQSESPRPVDLGILYLDSEANRRWFLRFDDSRTLSQINAVFVTVEPHGGSQKPTGKPFLFATLLKEPNHP